MLARDFQNSCVAVVVHRDTPQELLERFAEISLEFTGIDSLGHIRIPDRIRYLFASGECSETVAVGYNAMHDDHLGWMGDNSRDGGIHWYERRGFVLVEISDFIQECEDIELLKNFKSVSYDSFSSVFA